MSALDAAQDLSVAAETLRQMREDTTDRQLEQRWEANRAVRDARLESGNG